MNIYSYIFIMLLCFFALLPLLQVAQYNRPVRDDYSYGYMAYTALKNRGNLFDLLKAAWEHMLGCYTTFSGLYTSAFILELHPGIFGEKVYILSTYIVLAVVYFFLFWPVYMINKYHIKWSRFFVFTATLVLETALVLWLPGPREGLYWYNGAMNYMPYAFMNFTNLSLLYEVDHGLSKRKGTVLIGVSMVLSFLISGGNQVTAFANILLLLFFAVYRLHQKKYWVLLPLATACLGFLIMYLSPGTAGRQSSFEQQGVIETMVATLKHVHKTAGDWISLRWLISLLLITPVAIEIAKKKTLHISGRFILEQILVFGVVICGMFCVPYFPMGWFGSGRITNVIWITFMAFSWYLYVLLWCYLDGKEIVNVGKICNGSRAMWLGSALTAACILMLLYVYDGTMSNSMWARQELATGKVQGYGAEMDARIEKYRDDTLTEVAVAPIENESLLLCGKELPTDPDEWPNDAMGKWYNKKIYLATQENP